MLTLIKKSELTSCFVLIAIFISILTSCGDKKNKPTVAPPIRVTIVEVVNDESEAVEKEYSGTVNSSESTTVSFSVAGTIIQLFAKEGDKVSKGQLLGKLRNGEYMNANNIAQAQLAEAQDAYNRLKKLHDANALPEIKWVEIQQKLKQAQNAAEIATRTLNDADLHSPASGTVTRKFADVGQTVMPVEPIYEIVSTNNLTIDISVSENEIMNIFPGQKAVIMIDTERGEALEGKVTEKNVVADPLTRSYTVKISLPNKDGNILPGMLGKVKLEKTEKIDSLNTNITLPSRAVLLDSDNRWFVWVVKDSVAERRFVSANELTSNGVVISEGLYPGDCVIIEGMQKVGTGSKVYPLTK